MWNEVLRKIDAKNTPHHAVARWGGDKDSLVLISDGINIVYRFNIKQERYFLRLTHVALRSEKELLAAISYQLHLFNHDVPVCEPILSRKGLWIEQIKQDEEIFLAHVCREVPGQPIHFNYSDKALYMHWGESLGKLHKAAQTYQENEHEYTSWKQSIDELKGDVVHESLEIQTVLQEIIQFYGGRIATLKNYGLTHGDHREGNVLSDGQLIHIIDFDLPSHNWFMEDFTRPFFDCVINDDKAWIDKFDAYLEGYLTVMPKESIDLSTFAKQIQMKSLEIYLWTKNNWNSEIAPGGDNTSKWLENIYKKLIERSWIRALPFD